MPPPIMFMYVDVLSVPINDGYLLKPKILTTFFKMPFNKLVVYFNTVLCNPILFEYSWQEDILEKVFCLWLEI